MWTVDTQHANDLWIADSLLTSPKTSDVRLRKLSNVDILLIQNKARSVSRTPPSLYTINSLFSIKKHNTQRFLHNAHKKFRF